MASQSKNVLFLCSGEPTRGVIAEAIMNRLGGDDFRAFCATINGSRRVPTTVTELLKSNRMPTDCALDELDKFCGDGAPAMDFVIALQPRSSEDPASRLPGHPMKANWRITDPAAVKDNPVERATVLRRSYMELENRIKLFLLVQRPSKSRVSAA
jgi:arsenate reductase